MTLFVFAVGVLVFAITVYGTVVGGGMALTKREIAQNPNRQATADETELGRTVPTRLKY